MVKNQLEQKRDAKQVEALLHKMIEYIDREAWSAKDTNTLHLDDLQEQVWHVAPGSVHAVSYRAHCSAALLLSFSWTSTARS